MRVLRREGHGARSPLFIGVHVLLACQAGAVITALHGTGRTPFWLYPVRLRRGWCRLAAGDIGSGCSEESPSDWSSRLAGLTRRLPLIDAGVGECGIAAPWCTDPASRSPQCFQGSHDRGPECPPSIPGRVGSAPRHRGLTNFCLVEEGDSSRWSMPATWGTGDLLQRALSAQGGVPEAVVPSHVHADHTGFAERARTKASAWWVHQADAAVAKGTKPGKLTPHRGGG